MPFLAPEEVGHGDGEDSIDDEERAVASPEIESAKLISRGRVAW